MKELNIFQKLFSGAQVASVGVNHTIDKKSIMMLCVGLFAVAVLTVLLIKIIK